ncbi:MAG: radical SAM family heme chaperone HemW [Candidatus Eremiobacteraeota bacterium]|nr:radical SAM family heme chaperone HemW [Candidatus Eremiobacteraeota bacterium]
MSGIYVHLPFCPYICPYCDFAKWPWRASDARRYLKALEREIDDAPDFKAQTLYFGGGTPNTYSADSIESLVGRLRKRFGTFREVTIEMNPDLAKADELRTYTRAGIDRLSIGVQSMIAPEIATLGRRHTPSDVRRVVEDARASGLRSISIDLMFAVPGQTLGSWSQTLRETIALSPDHISVYGLTVEKRTPFCAWREREPAAFFDDAAEAALYESAIDALSAAGYQQYEVSNFARPGHECAHNANYWENGEYLGFGVGAASFHNGERSVHTRQLSEYVGAVESDGAIPSQRETLRDAARTGEAAMLSLRTRAGIRFEEFNARYGIDFLKFYAPVIRDLRAAGLLDVDDQRATLTKRGLFLANDVCGAFVTFA